MRRRTLGILILGGGAILSLPFRRPAIVDSTTPAQQMVGAAAKSRTLLDADALELLVREVTSDVDIPTLYSPPTESMAPVAASVNTMPLTYQDVAVPVDRDPYYANRFNAAADPVAEHGRSATVQSRKHAELEAAFSSREFVETDSQVQSPAVDTPGIDGGDTEPPSTAKLASTGAVAEHDDDSRRDRSVLTRLPPPAQWSVNPNSTDASPPRQRYWIRQPD